MRILAAVCVAPVLSFAQAGAKFEVATIKPIQFVSAADMRTGQTHVGMRVTGSRVEIRLNSLRSLIRQAYDVRDDQIVAPAWIGFPSWDVAAKMPEGASRKQIPEMLQALLADRFKLKAHRELREQPVFALVVGPDGPKLTASPPNAEVRKVAASKGGFTSDYMLNEMHVQATRSGDDENVYITGPDGTYTITTIRDRTRIHGSRVTADKLAGILASLFFDRHLLNLTGLDGRYEFAIDLPPGVDAQANRVEIGPDGQRRRTHEALRVSEIRASLEKMGLRIDARRAPVEMIVVDHAAQEPTPN